MMNILILAYNYFPDLSAGSFRTTALVEELQKKIHDKTSIDVLTTQPNRYATYKVEAKDNEQQGNIHIHRIKLPVHKNGMIDQALAYTHYIRQVKQYIRGKQYDLVYATSSRLMTAVLGAWISTRQKTKLLLDIRDIFVDSIDDIFPVWSARAIKPIFSMLEKWSFSKANHINLVSEGFSDYFKQRYSKKALSYFTNGIDTDFLEKIDASANDTSSSSRIKRIVYAGNIGEGQGLHKIIPDLARVLTGEVEFQIIGDGGRRKQLESVLQSMSCSNVTVFDPCDRKALMKAYQAADVLFLHLNDYPAFEKVLPSKIFEYAAIGKPILAGVAGYAADFIRAEISNAAVFKPCDAQQALKAMSALNYSTQLRHDFIAKYNRSYLMDGLATQLLSMANSIT